MKNLLITTLLAVNISLAQWHNSNLPVPDTDNMKSNGQFGAHLFFTKNPNQFFESWMTHNDTVKILNAEEVNRNDTLLCVVIFSGCPISKSKTCDLQVEYIVTNPNGELYHKQDFGPLLNGKSSEKPGELLLSESLIGIIIEPNDILGEYTVTANIIDKDKNSLLSIKKSFMAKK